MLSPWHCLQVCEESVVIDRKPDPGAQGLLGRTDGKHGWSCWRKSQGVLLVLNHVMRSSMLVLGLHHVQNGSAPAIQFDTYEGVICGWQHTEDVAADGEFLYSCIASATTLTNIM